MYANILPDNYTLVIDEDALKILNGESVAYPKKSIARAFGRTLVTQGIHAAMANLQKLKADPDTYTLDEDDFKSLG